MLAMKYKKIEVIDRFRDLGLKVGGGRNDADVSETPGRRGAKRKRRRGASVAGKGVRSLRGGSEELAGSLEGGPSTVDLLEMLRRLRALTAEEEGTIEALGRGGGPSGVVERESEARERGERRSEALERGERRSENGSKCQDEGSVSVLDNFSTRSENRQSLREHHKVLPNYCELIESVTHSDENIVRTDKEIIKKNERNLKFNESELSIAMENTLDGLLTIPILKYEVLDILENILIENGDLVDENIYKEKWTNFYEHLNRIGYLKNDNNTVEAELYLKQKCVVDKGIIKKLERSRFKNEEICIPSDENINIEEHKSTQIFMDENKIIKEDVSTIKHIERAGFCENALKNGKESSLYISGCTLKEDVLFKKSSAKALDNSCMGDSALNINYKNAEQSPHNTVKFGLNAYLKSSTLADVSNDIMEYSKLDFMHIMQNDVSKKHKSKHKIKAKKSSKSLGNIKHLLIVSNKEDRNISPFIDNLYNENKTDHSNNFSKKDEMLHHRNGLFDIDHLKTDSKEKPLSHVIQDNAHSGLYCHQMWSGDCKLNGDSEDSFLDNFEEMLESTTTDLKMVDSKDHIYSTRLKKDVDFDEGFSENESFEDLDSNPLIQQGLEKRVKERGPYCGDCDYNSSNSKVLETAHVLESSQSDLFKSMNQDDEASDSDGGTDILNSVNDTVNKFNAIMEGTANTAAVELDSSNDIVYTSDTECHSNPWMPPLPKSLCDHITPVLVDSPVLSVVKTTAPYKDGRLETPLTNLSYHSTMLYNQQQLSLANISNFNQENPSRLLGSPLNVQNWCSYNYNYIPPQPFNLPFKPSKNYEVPISSNYDIKVSSWLPYLSSGTTSFPVSAHNHQQVHRILLPPHLSLPPMSLGSMQHNMIHLPQLYQQQSSIHEPDYSDRKYAPSHTKIFHTPKNVTDSRTVSLNIIPNTNNHSNIPIYRNVTCQNSFKGPLDKSQRACCFYMRGGCKKEDCEYAHDLSKVTCKFWEKGDCFKADTCPFKHGYQKE